MVRHKENLGRTGKSQACDVNSRILFVDQTGQLGGAEFCLADLAFHLKDGATVLLFEDGPFRTLLQQRGVQTIVLEKGLGTSGINGSVGMERPGRRRVGANHARLIYPPPSSKVSKKATLWNYVSALPGFIRILIGTLRVARGYDLIYANTAKALIVTAFAAAFLRKPFLFHLHDIIDGEHFNRINRWLLVFAANRAAGIIANSEATANAYRKAGGRNRKMRVIPNGFDIEDFRLSSEPEVDGVRASLGDEDEFLVGLFGRITAWKGQRVLIQALGLLPQVKAVVVGDALFTEQDQQYKRELVDLCRHLGVADRVHFTGFQQNVLPFLHAVDLVVHCSIAPEPFGRVIVEAQLAGKPVIAARSGAPTEIIEDGVNGLLVTPGNPEDLATAIWALLMDPAWAGSMASNGRDSAENRYALEKVLRDWVDFIDTSSGGAIGRPSKRDKSTITSLKAVEASEC